MNGFRRLAAGLAALLITPACAAAEEGNTVKAYKTLNRHNPVEVQKFAADPWAMVYGDRVYLYMTGDEPVMPGGDRTAKPKTNDTTGSIVNCDSKLVVIQGLKDYIVAESDGLLLVVPKADEQNIKNLVNSVKLKYGDEFV